MTKPILVLILGCLPLAGLTVASFAGIGDADSKLPSIGEEDLLPPGASVSVPSAQDLQGDETLRAAVAEREFLAGEPLSDSVSEANPVYLDSLAADWKQWTDATDLVGEVLSLEEDLLGAGLPQLEAAVKRIEKIQDECREKDPAGSAGLMRVLDGRKLELRDEIAFLKKCKVVEDLVAEAEAAYTTRDFSKSFNTYERILTQHESVLTPEALKRITEARQDAAFWRDIAYLRLTSPVTEEPSQQRDLLVGFLDSYKDLQGESERQKLTTVEQKLESVNAELRRLAMNEAALQPISTLDRYDYRPFDEGLTTAARIVENYPTNWVRSQLQERVVLWLAQALPPKQFDEPTGIQEVETNSGNVLRGFFEPVVDAGGEVIGYKRYPTAEERDSPTRNVGRYPAADLRGVPNLSVPRQCVDAYDSARDRLLADPGNRDCWAAFQRTCDSAETTLIDYRRKPGSSRELLAFSAESQFVRNVLSPALWSQMEAIWGR